MPELGHGLLSAAFDMGSVHRCRTGQVLCDRISALGEQQRIPLISGMALDSADHNQMVSAFNELFTSAFKSRNAIPQQR
ncbi:MAG: hypothetical protein A2X72_14620 [Burkholderiales bacterium GWF1_66_17]|nr:MAG: hypothetical protein A2X73_17875 [Burkholderiales bacterium GWE1_65_30]OGA91082.1 MAG: hypothetical protein A2X72_14620 [Burkholderiales bacterium GWF1_66_17]